MTRYFRFKGLFLRKKWMSPAYVGIDKEGLICYLSNQPPQPSFAMEAVEGYALPGFQNAHSHAFQYAIAGLSEANGNDKNDFWRWRKMMYKCALSIDPDQMQAIATMLYAEMLRHGYVHVAEFHYIHHDKNGKPYNHQAEMGERMVLAAAAAGINITLIPILYQQSNFGKKALQEQRRFISKTTEAYLMLLESSRKMVERYDHANLGFGIHSLRAVNTETILSTYNNVPTDIPFHIHIAEQHKEVDDCIAYLKDRPVRWLLNHMPVNERFHLVHATHTNEQEILDIASTNAHTVLCPSTEGNLGDGFFNISNYSRCGGRWSIGSDSHIGLSPLEEFRILDYGQRLRSHFRNSFAKDTATYMIDEAATSGCEAMGLACKDHFDIGKPLNTAVFDANTPLLSSVPLAYVTPTIVFATDSSYLYGVLINGKWVIQKNSQKTEKRHNQEVSFAHTIQQLRTATNL